MKPSVRLFNPIYWAIFLCTILITYASVLTPFDHRHDWVNRYRRSVYPIIHSIISKLGLFSVSTLSSDSLAIKTHKSSDEAERILQDAGFTLAVSSSVKKLPDGSFAYSDWIYRESGDYPDFLAIWQTHATIVTFEERTHIYAHHEYSSINPLVGYYHITGMDKSAKQGIKKVRKLWNKTL